MIEAYEDEPITYSPQGLINIVKKFKKPSNQNDRLDEALENSKNLFIILQKQFKNIKEGGSILKYTREIHIMINTYFLLQLLKKFVSIQEKLIIADKKLAKVLILIKQINHFSKFIESSVWRNQWLELFIVEIKRIRGEKLNELKNEKVSTLDYEGLSIMESLFKDEKGVDIEEDKSLLNLLAQPKQEHMQKFIPLFNKLQEILYNKSPFFFSKNSQKFKLMIRYLKWVQSKEPIIMLNEKATKLYQMEKKNGHLTLKMYFEEVTDTKLEKDKNQLKSIKFQLESARLAEIQIHKKQSEES